MSKKVDGALTSIGTSAAGSGSPGKAFASTFAAGVVGTLTKALVSPLSAGQATGTCLGGNGCSAGQAALAVGGDALKIAAIGPPAVAAVAGGGAATAADVASTSVTHFTSDATVDLISSGSGQLNAGSFVTLPSEIPAGATSSQVESLLVNCPGERSQLDNL